ncbi:hypothetical protein Bca52824_071695 [Brassica carinata]|uniref:Uncharacterized protein n=1 Tax=Brassica carinata TaxID=52824 RepID=A0A8X7U509_BRACI|nr:hypothetical protein Bca52824_071695 [Brassica carinata]
MAKKKKKPKINPEDETPSGSSASSGSQDYVQVSLELVADSTSDLRTLGFSVSSVSLAMSSKHIVDPSGAVAATIIDSAQSEPCYGTRVAAEASTSDIELTVEPTGAVTATITDAEPIKGQAGQTQPLPKDLLVIDLNGPGSVSFGHSIPSSDSGLDSSSDSQYEDNPLDIEDRFIDVVTKGMKKSARKARSRRCSSVVKARLLRFWEAKNVKRVRELMWMDLLMVDVNVSDHDASHRLPQFREKLTAGTMFSVSGFDVSRCAQNFRLTDSSLLIRFNESTYFEELTEPVSPLPEEAFRFRNQSELIGLANTNTQLPESDIDLKLYVDIIGEILGVKNTVCDPPEEKNRVMVTMKLDSDDETVTST